MKKSIKKPLSIGITGFLSLLMIGVSAFASANNVSSYETYKRALIKTSTETNNYTSNLDFTIKVDGEELATGESVVKFENKDRTHSETTFNIHGESIFNESYKEGSNYYTYNQQDDLYYHINNSSLSNFDTTATVAEKKFIGAVADLFTGDMKNYFTQDGNRISLYLTKNQIPEIAQLGLTVVTEKFGERNNDFSSEYYDHEKRAEIIAMMSSFKNASFDSAFIDTTLDDNGNIATTDMGLVLKGFDSSGNEHKAEILIKQTSDNFGNTKVEPFDAKGKTIEDGNSDTYMRFGRD